MDKILHLDFSFIDETAINAKLWCQWDIFSKKLDSCEKCSIISEYDVNGFVLTICKNAYIPVVCVLLLVLCFFNWKH